MVFRHGEAFNIFPVPLPDVKTISYEEIKALLEKSQNFLIVDVRKEEELEKGRIPGSVNIPIDTVETALSMEPEMFKAKYGVNKPSLDSQELVFHCFMGKRGQAATETANKLGYVNARNYAGAYKEWSEREGK